MSGTVGFLGTGFAFRSESFQKTFRGYGIPPGAWPMRKNRKPAQGPPKGAKKVKTRIIRNDKLMVVEGEEVCEGDEVLGEEVEYQLPPGWDYEAEGWEDEELETAYGELPEATYAALPAAGESYYGDVAGYLGTGE